MAKTIEIPANMIERAPSPVYGPQERLRQRHGIRKSPLTKRALPEVSASVGDVRIVNNQAIRPMLPAIQPQMQPGFGFKPRRMGETTIHARRFGASNFWAGTPVEASPSLGDIHVFDAEQLFSGWDDIGFVWNIKAQTLEVYASRGGETWKVRFSTGRLVHLFNRGLREMGSEKRIPYPNRPSLGWNLFDEIGKLGNAIGNKMIEPAVRDVGKAIDTVVNNPVVQGIVTAAAMIPPFTAIGGPALAALSVAKSVKTAGDVVGGISDGIKHGFTPERALGLVNNVVGGVPGLPPAAKGIMQGALGAAGVGVKLLGGGQSPGAIITQTLTSAPQNVSAALSQLAQDAKASGLVVPPGMLEGLDKVMKVAVPGTRLPRFSAGYMTDGTKALQLLTPGGTTVPFNQTVQYLTRFAEEEAKKPRGMAADLKRAGINPGLIASAQAAQTAVIPRKAIRWTPKKRQAMAHGGKAASDWSAEVNAGGSRAARALPRGRTLQTAVGDLPPELRAQFIGLLHQRGMSPSSIGRYPVIGNSITMTLLKTPALRSLKSGLDAYPALKSKIITAEANR